MKSNTVVYKTQITSSKIDRLGTITAETGPGPSKPADVSEPVVLVRCTSVGMPVIPVRTPDLGEEGELSN